LLAQGLRIDSDLGLFLPRAHDREAAVLVDELRSGAAARTLLLGISGAPPARLAELSRTLLADLRGDARLQHASNGSGGLPRALGEWVMENRYALTVPGVNAFDANGLGRALRQRLADLAAGSNLLDPEQILRDPTAASLAAFARLAPPGQPTKRHGIWMSAAGDRAMMLLELSTDAASLDQQALLIRDLHALFARRSDAGERLLISGPIAFSVDARRTISAESRRLALAASACVAVLLFAAYRASSVVVLATLPVACSLLAGTTAVSMLFGGIHGITLAFGITVLGVAMDYPIHLFSHAAGRPQHAIRKIWPTLRLGLLSTSMGYGALLGSDFPGLAQLGVFAITGLAAAAAVTRWVLPHWLTGLPAATRQEPAPVRASLRALLILVGAALIVVAALDPRPWLESDIAALSPIPEASKRVDRDLRRDMALAEATHLLLVEGQDIQQVLQRQERLLPALAAARAAGELAAFDAAARILPSVAAQRERLAALPAAPALRTALEQATSGLPLRAARFEPFVDDVERARASAPLEPFTARTRILDGRLGHLIEQRAERWIGRVLLIGLQQPADLEARIRALNLPGTDFVSLHDTGSRMLRAFLHDGGIRALWLGLAIVAALVVAQRRAAVPVVVAVLAALGFSVAVLHLLDEALSIFHMIALLLVLGIGVDYGLFRARGGAPGERGDTVHAVRTCWLTTLAVFGLLASSKIPVLHTLGLTVAIGVSACYVASMVLVHPRTAGGVDS